MEEKCHETEYLERKHDEFDIHKNLKEKTYTQRKTKNIFMTWKSSAF